MSFNKIIKHWRWLTLAALFWLIAIPYIPHEFIDLGGDSAQYIILAESLSQGKGLRMANYPGEPLSFYYPPVFPLLLYPIVYFLGRNFYIMHFLVAILGYGSLRILYLTLKQYDKQAAFPAVCLLAANWIFFLYSTNYILSDIPYLFFTSITILLSHQYIRKESALNKKGALLILGLLLTYFTRFIGITLFFGLTLLLIITRREDKFKKLLFIGAVFAAACAFWNAAKSLQPAQAHSHFRQLFLIDPYAPEKGSLFANPIYFILRFAQGAEYYYRLFADIFSLSILKASTATKECLSGFVFGLTFLGLWHKFRENKECVIHYYFIFYFLLIIYWPFREGVRFIVPILPFIFFYFLAGLKNILSFLRKRFSLPAFYLFAGTLFVFAVLNLKQVTAHVSTHNYSGLPKPHQHFILIHRWIKENLPQDGIIISRKPTITYFYTNRKAIVYPFSSKPQDIWQEAVKNKIKYILADEFSRETYFYLLPFLSQYGNKLKLLHRIGETGLFELINDDARFGEAGIS
ncbi:hypothetical protein EPN16_04830 [bacterium]|nr:MAG: hypothetical protein EPN16_04830 [bacterium]